MTAFKSMLQKCNHDFKGKCPCIQAGTLEPMRVRDILTVLVFKNKSKTHKDIKFGKKANTIMLLIHRYTL